LLKQVNHSFCSYGDKNDLTVLFIGYLFIETGRSMESAARITIFQRRRVMDDTESVGLYY
jgi:hypothetical protein